MKSYSATMIETGLFTGKPTTACGSFGNISIDGRLSFENAVEVARETFKREAGEKYIGFAIEKTERFVNYMRPVIVDNKAKAEDVAFLL